MIGSGGIDRIRILSVDDHPLYREGIGAIINCQPDMSLAGVASNGKEAIEAFRALRPDVTLMDLRLPDLGGLDVMIAIRAEFADARVIVLTTFERDAEVHRALKAGARGYLLKTMPVKQMLETIRQVNAGGKCVPPEIAAGLAEHLGDEALSDREVEVLRHVAAGNRNRDIADRLFIAEETVKVHIKHIMSKLRANDRTQSVAIAARRGIISL
ncbi:MAG TPA: response regulator transcription factor [Bryobacteraceae bacterium]